MERSLHSFHRLANRRGFLARSGMGFALLGLRDVMAEPKPPGGDLPDPLAPSGPHFAPKAKRVIHIFMNGGLSHVDSFDPKPMLAKYDGQPLPAPNLVTERLTGAAFASPFQFTQYGQSGIPISDMFPHLGQHADD
ncbi:MAG: DUF1501 domain-containing protein, partial [Verrucomicrobia bacterium]|nr:DUF1501 domain-containing protein [Verrucomicrobiota bacterium]